MDGKDRYISYRCGYRPAMGHNKWTMNLCKQRLELLLLMQLHYTECMKFIISCFDTKGNGFAKNNLNKILATEI
jgi:hypothetical protein